MKSDRSVAGSTGFVFRENDSIGDPDAELDHNFLADCFVDPGAFELIRDTKSSPRILVGRTGSGKTALLYKLSQTEEHAVEFNPESLSLNYISNSTILPILFELGVNLDLFFDLLWRHVFASELIRQRYNITSPDQQESAFSRLIETFSKDPSRSKALAYLRRWSDKFWIEADERVKEITERLDKAISLQGGLDGTPISHLTLRAQAAKSTQARSEVVKRCQSVINAVQAKELADIVDLMSACLDDEQKRYFILVDKLDDQWVDNAYKAALIRGLVRSVRAFQKIRQAKVVVAMRSDLLERVFDDDNLTTQREKFESLFYSIKWTREKLTAALDERINKLVRSQYSGSARVTHRNVLVGEIGRKGAGTTSLVEYMLERTLMRPRDLISYFNVCIREAGPVPRITAEIIKNAEREYSRQRLEAIGWEWRLNYPNLIEVTKQFIAQGPAHFNLADVTELQCIDLVARIEALTPRDAFTRAAEEYDRSGDCVRFQKTIFFLLYDVGLVSLKTSNKSPAEHVMQGTSRLSIDEITETTRISINKTFWKALGISDAKFQK